MNFYRGQIFSCGQSGVLVCEMMRNKQTNKLGEMLGGEGRPSPLGRPLREGRRSAEWGGGEQEGGPWGGGCETAPEEQ